MAAPGNRKRSSSLKTQGQAKRLQAMPFSRMIPNMVTLIALCTGLSAVRFALMERYEWAVSAILIAAILDVMDGRLARMLGVSSHFGAELDSFSDFVSFGVAPGVLLYITALSQWRGLGWAIVLFFVVCSALRLARFNVANLKSFQEQPAPSTEVSSTHYYFTGVPSPSGAMIALLGLMMGFAFESPWESMPWLHAIFLIIGGVLMISRIPTFSLKGKQIPHRWILPLMVFVGILIASLINAFWHTMMVLVSLYLLSIPISYRLYKKKEA